MSALKPVTTQRYAAALSDFSYDLKALGMGVHELTEEELDWFLAERVVDLFLRWLSDRSAREYLRRGEVSLTRLRVDISTSSWSLAYRYCTVGAHVWAVV